MSEQQSAYQRKIKADRLARLKPSGSLATWQHDGKFAVTFARTPAPAVTVLDAISELRAAVDAGREMPWAMVGIKWEVAAKLLEMMGGE